MKTRTKVLVLTLCAVLLVTATVFTTLAYLQSSDKVTNTFTVGKVAITLDEASVNELGVALDKNGNTLAVGTTTGAARVEKNTYKLLPGHTYIKDPTIRVSSDSEDSYLFVKVENGLAGIEKTGKTIADQMTSLGWICIDADDNIWAYNPVDASGKSLLPVKKNSNVIVFESFDIKDDANADTLKSYAGKTVVVTAYAIQADGFDTYSEAWNAAGSSFAD